MLTRRIVFAAFAALIAFGAGHSARNAQAAEETAAAAHVEQLAAQSLAILNRTDLSNRARQAALAETLDWGLDIPLIARAVIGKAGRQASAATRQRFEEIFSAYLIGSVTRKLEDQAGGTLTLLGTKTRENGAVLVESRLVATDGRQIRIQSIKALTAKSC